MKTKDYLSVVSSVRGTVFEHPTSLSSDGKVALIGLYDDGDKGHNSGAAYVSVVFEDNWIREAKLTADDGKSCDSFGSSVSLSGDGKLAVIGAHYAGDDRGAVYVFGFDGTEWKQQAKLTASDGEKYDWFGSSVSISGDGKTILIAAQGCADEEIGVGAAYVFSCIDSVWVEQAKLSPGVGGINSRFGYSVSLSSDGQTAVVGAFDDSASDISISAYVYVRFGDTWIEQAKLRAEGGSIFGHYFGCSISLSGDGQTVAIGSYGDDGSKGSVIIFVRSRSSWTQQAKLVASDGTDGDWFGYSSSLSGDGLTVLISTFYVNKVGESGSTYVFIRQGDEWVEKLKLSANDTDSSESFNRILGRTNSLSSSGEKALLITSTKAKNGDSLSTTYAVDLNKALREVA